ncbi:UNVERIFIED_CONTAM: bacillithiol system redox-active protein YtxJ [Halobacillus marinus]|uniref:bacillithiol system redox-active protein YtxJ n=1 Tax=Bacillaceae TaxID=186817 RepID=UPI0002A4DC8D|nr:MULTISPECIES: bacillithiol system redox-active protein YtxJ [Bacillaceae]ELK47331.1 hypothetical protein D479_07777 [Halobacillus sp. BAB-2008]QHT47444.1 bacillithiol system redox-active protein YtxJ [Bacillus sp. SB49]
MEENIIETMDEFEKIRKEAGSFFLLKHSLTCPISANAKGQYDRFAERSEYPCYTLYVQTARPLSNYVAEQFSIRHQSPQAIFFKEGEAVWDASHGSITEERLSHA